MFMLISLRSQADTRPTLSHMSHQMQNRRSELFGLISVQEQRRRYLRTHKAAG